VAEVATALGGVVVVAATAPVATVAVATFAVLFVAGVGATAGLVAGFEKNEVLLRLLLEDDRLELEEDRLPPKDELPLAKISVLEMMTRAMERKRAEKRFMKTSYEKDWYVERRCINILFVQDSCK
jgi:hypothetical protein